MEVERDHFLQPGPVETTLNFSQSWEGKNQTGMIHAICNQLLSLDSPVIAHPTLQLIHLDPEL